MKIGKLMWVTITTGLVFYGMITRNIMFIGVAEALMVVGITLLLIKKWGQA